MKSEIESKRIFFPQLFLSLFRPLTSFICKWLKHFMDSFLAKNTDNFFQRNPWKQIDFWFSFFDHGKFFKEIERPLLSHFIVIVNASVVSIGEAGKRIHNIFIIGFGDSILIECKFCIEISLWVEKLFLTVSYHILVFIYLCSDKRVLSKFRQMPFLCWVWVLPK